MASQWTDELAGLRRVAFDANALIYFLDGRDPYRGQVVEVLRMLEDGRAVGFLSTVVEMELLVRPLRTHDTEAVERIETLLRLTPNLLVRPVARAVARAAAEVRAATGLRTPDAIIAASAILDGFDVIIGNDRDFARHVRGVRYVCLDDFAA